VGSSTGAVVGALYAAHPSVETSEEIKALKAAYARRARESASGSFLLGLLSMFMIGPVGGLLALSDSNGSRITHAGLVAAFNDHLKGATIEQLPIPFRTSYLKREGTTIRPFYVATGSVAEAVGSSTANPFLFSDVDVMRGPVDPGVDSLLAVPIAQACSAFPNMHILAVNASGRLPVIPRDLACPVSVVTIKLPKVADQALTNQAALEDVVAAGQRSVESWLRSENGVEFLERALSTVGTSNVRAEPLYL
jgi:predicted acylesterase/phospholipase RssA